MAKDIRQEMADIHGSCENKCFYRLQLALDFLNDRTHPFMRFEDYVVLTGLPKAVASKEPIEFREKTETSITTTGRGNNKAYLKRL